MSSLIIQNMEPEIKEKLHRRAAVRGRSMQKEARNILQKAVGGSPAGMELNFYDYVRSLVEPLGGVDDLELPMRELARAPPSFD